MKKTTQKIGVKDPEEISVKDLDCAPKMRHAKR